jgi:hypothetical protein
MHAREADAVAAAPSTPRRVFDTLILGVRLAAISNVASLIASMAIGGLGGRFAMWIAGLTAPAGRTHSHSGAVIGHFSAQGILEITIIAVQIGGPAGVLYIITRPWLEAFTRYPRVVFAVIGVLFFSPIIIEPGNSDFWILGHTVLMVSLFTGMVLLFVLVASALTRVGERRVGHPRRFRHYFILGLFTWLAGLFQIAGAIVEFQNRPWVGWTTYGLIAFTCVVGFLSVFRPALRPFEKTWVRGIALTLILGMAVACGQTFARNLSGIFEHRSEYLRDNSPVEPPPASDKPYAP